METDELSDNIDEILTRGVERIYPSPEILREKLTSGKPIRIYFGIDPTGETLHLGHAISLLKLRKFQELGHKVILLIGDFTAQIGDPTGKAAARAVLTHDQVLNNAKLYKQQASQFLRFEGDNAVELRYNSDWLSVLTFGEILKLASQITVAQIIKRDMFQERIKNESDIHLHEFLYPVMQGYDSVALKVDAEIGGNDQTFNMLMGRDLAKKISGSDKIVISMKLLTDSTGKKMGKTEGNMVSVSDSAREMYGKIMSWSDKLIMPGFELCTTVSSEILLAIEGELNSGVNPRDLKMRLAREIVSLYYGAETAANEEEYFTRTLGSKEMPEDVTEIKAKEGELLREVLVANGYLRSISEFRQKVKEGAIDVDGAPIESPDYKIEKTITCKIGKHKFAKIVV